MTQSSPDHQVIIVGGGFAGVAAAKRLGKKNVSTLLIDRNTYQQFQPLLYQVATAQLPASDVAEPLRSTFRRHPSVQVVTAEVASIDAGARSVTLTDGTVHTAGTVVVSAGAAVNFFGTPGAEHHTHPLYSVDDATRLAADLIAELDDTDAAVQAGSEPEPMNIVVVGGGPTGVETAGAIAEAIKSVVPNYFSGDVGKHCAVHLVDRGPTVLGPFSQKSQDYAHNHLKSVGVKLRLGTGVSSIDADSVTLSDGSTLPTRIVIWAGGLAAEPVVATAGVATGRGGRIDVNPDLTVPGVDGFYALGDAANIPDGNGKSLPQLGSVALQSGQWAAANILADLAGEPRRAFDYTDRGFMAMIGRMAAVAEIGPDRRQLEGPAAFAGWLAVHAALLPSRRSRFDAVRNWTHDYFTDHRSASVLDAVARPTSSPLVPDTSL